ncbi:MAG: immunoglobulin domain-containing protein, partial [Terriglobales bacterium]
MSNALGTVTSSAATLTVLPVTGEYTFVTLAGSPGGADAVDGLGGATRFNQPLGVAVDSVGNVYVADTLNHTIRKVTTAGMVTTLAGLAGNAGSADGTGANARFNQPFRVAVDAAGDAYVADTYNHTIRKITPAGVTTTLAGLAGSSGSADGTGSAARFYYPESVAMDSTGNLYVADTSNQTIRKVTAAGVVMTLAGLAGVTGSADGTGSAARFNSPEGVAVDSAGNLYVTDTNNRTIRQVTPAGLVTTLAGLAGNVGSADGTGSAARFNAPSGMAVDSAGNVYVADYGNDTIRKVTPAGVVTTLVGLAGNVGSADGTGSASRFNEAEDLALDAGGNLYVADSFNHTIRKVTPTGVVTTLAGLAASSGSADGIGSAAQFNRPGGVAVDSAGNVYVVDTFNHTIRKVTPAGVVTTLAGLAGSSGSADGTGSAAKFYYPQGVAVDSTGNVFVADTVNETIRQVTPVGTSWVVTTLAGLAGSEGSADGTGSAARLADPERMGVDSAGNVYVADEGDHTIRKVTPLGVVTTLAGLAGSEGSTDGAGSAARFYFPEGVGVDSAGNVYVADTWNQTIRKATPAGVVTTLAGLAGTRGSADGSGSASRFNFPSGVAVDSAGIVYVADYGDCTIRKVTAAGAVTTVAGLASQYGSADGTGSGARFYTPEGLAVDSAGNVYVADTVNHTIRKSFPTCPDLPTIDLSVGPVGASRQLDAQPVTANSWQWTLIRRPTGSTADLSAISIRNPTFTPDVADVYVFRLKAINAAGAMSIRTLQFTALAPVVITVQPQSQTVNLGTSVTFTVVPSGSGPLSYQWSKNGNAISGATSASLTLNSVSSADGATYTVDVSNAAGTVTSSTATLTVLPVTGEYTFVTLVGSPGGGDAVDALGSAARFNRPRNVAVDSSGNVYVADGANHTIRKLTPSGSVTTLAGLAGSPGSADGAGGNARFNQPASVAVDSVGNVYVADTFNHTLRKVTPTGMVTTLAGLAGSSGATDGTGSAARFYNPQGAAVDTAGNVYVADSNNSTVRKVTAAGVVTTLAGLAASSGSADGIGSAARFSEPTGVAVDNSGNVFVGDFGNNTIRKVTPAGLVTTLAGLAGATGSTDGTGSAARFYAPQSVAVDAAGNVYVADSINHTIRQVTAAGVVTTLAGLAGSSGSADGTGNAARFDQPTGVAVDGGGNVYVADSANNTIRTMTPTGVVTTLAGLASVTGSTDASGSAARFYYPQGVAVGSAGNVVYVADTLNHTIRQTTAAGVVTTLAGLAGSSGSVDGTGNAARFFDPWGVAVDTVGNAYVADLSNNTIRKVTPAGLVTTLAGLASSSGSADGTGSAARFNNPQSVAVDTLGNVYVADTLNHTIRQVTSAGMVTTLAGLAGSFGGTDGTGAAARFYNPEGVAVDTAGNVYVADFYNSAIRKLTPTGVVATLAGLVGVAGSVDGLGSAARFYLPGGVAVDSAGNVYVADTHNQIIRKVTPAGAVTTLGGLSGSSGSADGTASVARFFNPWGLAADNGGNLYVADTYNQTIRKSVPTCPDLPI